MASNEKTTLPWRTSASWHSKYEMLLREGIEEYIARGVVMNHILHWTDVEVADVFSRVLRPSSDFAYFRASDEEFATWNSPTLERPTYKEHADLDGVSDVSKALQTATLAESDEHIHPPRELMLQSVSEQKALCFNKNLQWSLKTEGYAALSHCWAEGLVPDHGKCGLTLSKLKRLFSLLEKYSINVAWVWTDVLAIPGGLNTEISIADELLKIDIINTMNLVYSRAQCTVVLDALLLQLQPKDVSDVAVATILGRWRGRMWTLQESLLQEEVLLLTATQKYVLREVVDEMKEAQSRNHEKFFWIWCNLAIMSKSKEPLTILDMTTACTLRRASVAIDYVRALFGLLDLKWSYDMTAEEGLAKIYAKRGVYETSAILFFAGAPRLNAFPTWAPSRLWGLEGITVRPSSDEVRWGIKGRWWLNKARKMERKMVTDEGRILFELEIEEGPDHKMQFATFANETPEAIDQFQKAVNAGTAYVVSESDLSVKQATVFATTVLLVRKVKPMSLNRDDVEIVVHLAVSKFSFNLHSGAQTSMVIRHNPPTEAEEEEDGIMLAIKAAIAYGVGEQNIGDSSLYEAIKAGDVSRVSVLLTEGALNEDYSKEQWAPLNLAAYENQLEIVKLLIAQGCDINSAKNSSNNDTAFEEACQRGHVGTTKFLIDLGADIGPEKGRGDHAMRSAAEAGHADILQLLLHHGVDPNQGDSHNKCPLLYACFCRNATRRFECIKILVEAGAEVNAFEDYQYGSATAIHAIADRGTPAEATYLLQNGADPKIHDQHGRDALFKALHDRGPNAVPRVATVEMTRLLLEAGCDYNAVYTKGPYCQPGSTPAYMAVHTKNWEILRTILEYAGDKCNVNAKLEAGGWTPLHLAVNSGQHIMARMLLEHGASPFDRLTSGHRVFDLAKNLQDTQMLRILISWLSDHQAEAAAVLFAEQQQQQQGALDASSDP